MAENREKGGCKIIESLDGKNIPGLLAFLINDLAKVCEDDLWYQRQGKVSYTKKNLHRLAIALRGNVIVNNYPEELPKLLNDWDWKNRH